MLVAERHHEADNSEPFFLRVTVKARDAATNCLDVFLGAEYRIALRFAIHESLVMVRSIASSPARRRLMRALSLEPAAQATFSACYLLKVAILYPDEVSPRPILSQVQALADLLSDISAERCVSSDLT